MKNYYLFGLVFFIIFYLFFTFVISFTFLSNSVVNNDFYSLKKYIDTKKLKDNLFNDFNEFSQSKIQEINKKINLNEGQIEFSGELTSSFFTKIFSKISRNFSKDFSDPKIILYFYFHSNEISNYLNQAILNLGNYNFENYKLENFIEKKESENIKKENLEKNRDKKFNLNLPQLIKRIKSTDYFFFISPIHFKISVKHQNIFFDVILKFNGLTWKIQKIVMPYNKLIDFQNLSFQN